MKCPFCSHQDTQVIETRVSEDGDCIRRRRQCGACEKRFTTYERPEVNFPAVVKKDGRRVEYDRHKLLGSFKLALRKRPVSTVQIDSAIERIEEKLLHLGQREVISSRIGELVMRELKKARQRWPTYATPACTAASRTSTSSARSSTKCASKSQCYSLNSCQHLPGKRWSRFSFKYWPGWAAPPAARRRTARAGAARGP